MDLFSSITLRKNDEKEYRCRYVFLVWLCGVDIEHFRGDRAHRGRKLPRGFQRVSKIELAVEAAPEVNGVNYVITKGQLLDVPALARLAGGRADDSLTAIAVYPPKLYPLSTTSSVSRPASGSGASRAKRASNAAERSSGLS